MRVVQVIGFSNSGKTTLTKALTEHFSVQGIAVAAVKHHGTGGRLVPDDTSDTGLFRQAGAKADMLVSQEETIWNIRQALSIEQIVHVHKVIGTELLIIEGFKQGPYPKLVLHAEEALPALENAVLHVGKQGSRTLEEALREIDQIGEILWSKSAIV
ncbi:molybdopterin-guanine dinucleotide biosynthesis protein B [Bacillus daqingensis]|uniref:Molybdopterin-guanine dinucleotide biosynthesis protein B n=1 Tax=Bacillus daqingensis TaxID=872396 RepID=A0ABV9NR30_9BACI